MTEQSELLSSPATDQTVRYYLNLSQLNEGEKQDLPNSIDVPVDEIDLIPDPQLRAALISKLEYQASDPKHEHYVYADADYSYSHSFRVRKTPMFKTFLNNSSPNSSQLTNENPNISRAHDKPASTNAFRRLARRIIG